MIFGTIAPRRSPVRVRLAPSEVAANAAACSRSRRRCGWPRAASQLSVNLMCGGAARGEGRDPRQGGVRWDRAAPAAFGSSAASTVSRTASTRYRVLDVGCGTGYFTRVMAEAVAPDGTAHGVDPSAEAIAQAKGLTHLANSWL